MNMRKTSNRTRPWMAGATASVVLLSLLGAAAIAGMLPSSQGPDRAAERMATARTAAAVPVPQVPNTRQGAKQAVSDQTAAGAHHKPLIGQDFDLFYRHQAAATRSSTPGYQ